MAAAAVVVVEVVIELVLLRTQPDFILAHINIFALLHTVARTLFFFSSPVKGCRIFPAYIHKDNKTSYSRLSPLCLSSSIVYMVYSIYTHIHT